MNVGIGTVAAQFFFWEYMSLIFGIVSLQCTDTAKTQYRKFETSNPKIGIARP
jgi:hypothetical protein